MLFEKYGFCLRPVTFIFFAAAVSGTGCTSDRLDKTAKTSVDSITIDAPLANQGSALSQDTQRTEDATPSEPTMSAACEAQGIGDEELFARMMCNAAGEFGFSPELVHSYGAGGVDVFISESDAVVLGRNTERLRQQTTGLTEWAKQNYTRFNAVEVTIVGGDSKIAKGSIIGTHKTNVELF